MSGRCTGLRFRQDVYTDYFSGKTHTQYRPLVTMRGQKHILEMFRKMKRLGVTYA